MLGIDEGADAAVLLRLGEAMQSQRGFARGFRAVDFDHPAARQAADAERDVEAERAGGHGVDVHRPVVLAEPHDRALAETALDLRERGIKGLRFVHGRSFDETKRCTHWSCSLWPGFGGHGSRRPYWPALTLRCRPAGEWRLRQMYTICSLFAICSWQFFGHISRGACTAMCGRCSACAPTSPRIGLRETRIWPRSAFELPQRGVGRLLCAQERPRKRASSSAGSLAIKYIAKIAFALTAFVCASITAYSLESRTRKNLAAAALIERRPRLKLAFDTNDAGCVRRKRLLACRVIVRVRDRPDLTDQF